MILEPTGGLANRLIAVLSVMRICEYYGWSLALRWTKSRSLNCDWHDLFSTKSLPLVSTVPMSATQISRDAGRLNDRAAPESAVLDLSTFEGELSLSTNCFLRLPSDDLTAGCLTHGPAVAELAFLFSRLELSHEVAARLTQARESFGSLERTTGLHVRRGVGDSSGAIDYFARVSNENYLSVLESISLVEPILLCTDSAVDRDFFKSAFPKRLRTLDPRSLAKDSDYRAIQDALVDLILLSECDRVVGIRGSSFSLLASQLGLVPFFELLPVTGEEVQYVKHEYVGEEGQYAYRYRQHSIAGQSAPSASHTADEEPMRSEALHNEFTNLALGRLTQQSSHYVGGGVLEVSGGCNGVKNGGFGFHTCLEDNPWWQVDLGSMCSIDEVRVFNRLSFRDRASSLRIRSSADGISWQALYCNSETRLPFGGIDGNPLICSPLGGVRARFVRLDLTERQYLHLDEVEIYGTRLVPEGDPLDADGPPLFLPKDFAAQMEVERTPVQYLYFDSRASSEPRVFDLEAYRRVFTALDRGEFEYYGETLGWLLRAVEKYSVAGKEVIVLGLTHVNCDAIAIHHGARRVFVIDYNLPVSEHPSVEVMRYEEFISRGIQVDAVISISTV